MILLAKSRIKNLNNINFNDTMLIHLRTGDVIDDDSRSVYEFLSNELLHENGTNYVKPLKYFTNILEKNNKLSKLKNVIIFSGFHMKHNHSKSFQYIEEIKKMFVDKGFNVQTRLNEDPDEDFVILCHAKYFIKSGGGFSHLISQMINKRNP